MRLNPPLRDAILHLHALDLEGQILTRVHQQHRDLGREGRGRESRDGSVPSRAQLWLGAMLLMAEPAAKPSHPASPRDASASDRWSSLLEQFNTSRDTETLKSLYIYICTAGVGEDISSVSREGCRSILPHVCARDGGRIWAPGQACIQLIV